MHSVFDITRNGSLPTEDRDEVCCSLLTDGTISDSNSAFCALVMLPRPKLIGRNFFDFCDKNDRDPIRECLASIQSQTDPTHFEIPVYPVSGDARLVDWTANLRMPSHPAAGEVILTGRDVTESRSYQRALQKLIAIGNDGNLSLDQRIPEILGVTHRYFGMRFGVVNRMAGNRVEVTNLADKTGELSEGMKFPGEDTYCGSIVRRGGIVAIPDIAQSDFCKLPAFKRVPLGSLLATPIHVNGRVHGALIFGDDDTRPGPFTTEQLSLLSLAAQWLSYELAAQQRSAELEAREKRYRNLYRHTPVMMHSVDWNGRLVEVSNTWLDQLGYSREEVIGHLAMEFMTEESALQAVAERMPGSAIHSDNQSGSYVFRRKDGSTVDIEMSSIGDWSELSSSGMAGSISSIPGQEPWSPTGSGPEVSLCVLIDVTERNRAQVSRAEANARLMRANEGLKRFNLIASHDLQEPLRKIRAFGSMLEKEATGNLSEDSVYAMRAMINSSKRLSALVEDLLAYTRQSNEGYDIEPVNFTSLLHNIAATTAIEQNIGPGTFEIGALPVIRSGRVPLERLFSNLLSNAVKYRSPERALKVQVLCEYRDSGKELEIIVRDNGIGIPESQIERVFEPFRRLCTRSEISGSGIGLAICRMVAARHGWQLNARQAPGCGTDFCLAIPARDVIGAGPGRDERAPGPPAIDVARPGKAQPA